MVNNKGIRCKIGILLVVSFVCTSCGTKEGPSKVGNNVELSTMDVRDDSSFTSSDSSEKSQNMNEESTSIQANIGDDKELLPQVEEVVSYPYYYLCHGMSEQQKQDYRKYLLDQGFEHTKEEIVSSFTYEYYADAKKTILIVDTGEVLIVSIADVYENMEKEEEAFPLETVLSYVQEEYNNQRNPSVSFGYPPEILIKCWINDLYSKTKIQAYQTLTWSGRTSGMYLIAGDQALRITDELGNICIADIDGNGTYELLSLYGFGSGIWRCCLNVYQYSNPIYYNGLQEVLHCSYSNCYVPNQGYGLLAFRKVSDSEIHLVEANIKLIDDTDKEEIIYGKDYGKLVIDGDKIDIEPEKNDEFPYYRWEDSFQDNSKDTSQKESFELSLENIPITVKVGDTILENIPELTVKVGDTILENMSWKELWGEETEEAIPFRDMMKSATDIPRFACPDGFGFKDEISLSFADGIKPQTIQVQDYLINENGEELYNKAGIIEREVRYGEDGNLYIGLMTHYALLLSSNTGTYTNPSYRGFRVKCQFDEQHTCEYVFVLSVEPAWIEK